MGPRQFLDVLLILCLSFQLPEMFKWIWRDWIRVSTCFTRFHFHDDSFDELSSLDHAGHVKQSSSLGQDGQRNPTDLSAHGAEKEVETNTFKSSRPALLCDSWIIWMCISPREFLEGLNHTLTNGCQDERVWTFRIRFQWACISMHFCPCEGAPLCSGYNHHGTLPILGAAMWCAELYMDSC